MSIPRSVRREAAFGAAVIDGRQRLVARIDDQVIDLAAACAELQPDLVRYVDAPVLNPLLAAGRPVWRALRSALQSWTDAELERHRHRLGDSALRRPVDIADYVDFYASEHHAANVGSLFRPDGSALTPNWKHLPIGYHGRAGTIVVSGTDIVRPCGQRRDRDGVVFGPSRRLDFEAEVGFVLGGASPQGTPVPLTAAREHIFGLCLINDWSARDIQAWESVPLGPFLGKSFATSMSPWIVPLDALDDARVRPPERDEPLLPYLDDRALEPWGFDVRLTVSVNGTVLARPPFAGLYWTAAQMLAHLTVNGASIRPGDLFASGTVSGPSADELGCLLELTRGGAQPVRLDDGSERSFLCDGDEVVISALVPAGRTRPELSLGEVRGRIVAA